MAIVLPDGITSIDKEGFRNCVFMKEIKLPETLTTINSSAFADCVTLKMLYIPKNVNSINYINGALANLKGLLSIVVDPANQTYESPNGCNGVIKKEGKSLVVACQNTIIPEGVSSIYGFQNQNMLESIAIPSSVTDVLYNTFYNCTNLKSVVAKCDTPPTLGNNAFAGINADCVLTVPYGKTKAYRDAGWGDGKEGSPAVFKEIVEDMSQYDVNRDKAVNITDVTTLVNKILGK